MFEEGAAGGELLAHAVIEGIEVIEDGVRQEGQ